MHDTLAGDLENLKILHPDLTVFLSGIDGISGILDWVSKANLPAAQMVILIQDEYTHDAILAWDNRHLVFGLT